MIDAALSLLIATKRHELELAELEAAQREVAKDILSSGTPLRRLAAPELRRQAQLG